MKTFRLKSSSNKAESKGGSLTGIVKMNGVPTTKEVGKYSTSETGTLRGTRSRTFMDLEICINYDQGRTTRERPADALPGSKSEPGPRSTRYKGAQASKSPRRRSRKTTRPLPAEPKEERSQNRKIVKSFD